MSDWRAAIERSGGMNSALLHGEALKALVDELTQAQLERDAARSEVAAKAHAEQVRVNLETQARHDLLAERQALVACNEQCRQLQAQLSKVANLVQAVRDEKLHAVPSKNLRAALAEYDK